jgi:peptide/nickel transport system permease protein
MAALLVPQFILAEVTLSFLGLGVGEPVPSWGNLLSELQKYSVLSSYWWMYVPAAPLVLLFLAYHWASSVLQEKFASVSA